MVKMTAVKNIFLVLKSLDSRRHWQILLLFLMQIITACLEVLSIGAVVPFLGALSDTEKLMGSPLIGKFVREIGVSDPQHLIIILAVFFGMGVATANLFRFLTLFYQQRLSAAIAVDLGHRLFTQTLCKPYPYFLSHNSGQMIGNVTNDLSSALGTLYSFFSIVTQGLIALFVASGLLIYNPQVALVLSGIILVAYSGIVVLVHRRLRHNGQVLSDNYRDMVQVLQEGVGGIRYVLLGRLQNYFVTHFDRTNAKFREKSAENAVIQQAPRFFLESIGVIAISAMTIGFATQGRDIATVIPLMGFLALCCYRLLPAVQQIYAAIGSIISLSVSLERVVAVIVEPIRPERLKPERVPLVVKDSLQFEGIYFDYHQTGERWTLEDLNFTILAKTTVALVGYTGSGKSTISDLILGLIEPQKGVIKIDGEPLGPGNMSAWQAGIAHVPQTIFLNDTTIAENIAYGVPCSEIDMEHVRESARLAQIHDFIESLPEGYRQKVGERGIRLSGGQRQRIGIARALYQNPSLIVFDEATSALDNKTEQDVVAAIENLRQDMTIVLIAHRLSTIQRADNILMFRGGRLVAQGRYEELQNNAFFQELAHSDKFQGEEFERTDNAA